MSGSPLLEVRDLLKTFGGVHAVSRLSFTLNKGELLGIIGPNGSGKTTTVNLITGFVKATPRAGCSLRARILRIELLTKLFG